MFSQMTEEREAALERDRARLKASWQVTKRVLFGIGAAVALSFTYYTGEHAGFIACRSEVTSAPR